MNIETAFANQKGGDDRVDETIVLHIVDVTKDVIVFPPGRDRQKIPVCAFHCLDGRPETQTSKQDVTARQAATKVIGEK